MSFTNSTAGTISSVVLQTFRARIQTWKPAIIDSDLLKLQGSRLWTEECDTVKKPADAVRGGKGCLYNPTLAVLSCEALGRRLNLPVPGPQFPN